MANQTIHNEAALGGFYKFVQDEMTNLVDSNIYTLGTFASLLGLYSGTSFLPDKTSVVGYGVSEATKKSIDTFAPYIHRYQNAKSYTEKVLLPGGTDVGAAAASNIDNIKHASFGWLEHAASMKLDKFVLMAAKGKGGSLADQGARLVDPIKFELQTAISGTVEALTDRIINGDPSVASDMFADDMTGLRTWVSDRNNCGNVDRATAAGVGFRAQYSNDALTLSLDLLNDLDIKGVPSTGGPAATTKPLSQLRSGKRVTLCGPDAFSYLRASAEAQQAIIWNDKMPQQGLLGMQERTFQYGKRTIALDSSLDDNELFDLDITSWQLRSAYLLRPTKWSDLSGDYPGTGQPMTLNAKLENRMMLICNNIAANVRLDNLTIPA